MPVYSNNVVNVPENLGIYTRMVNPIRPACELYSLPSSDAVCGSLNTSVTTSSASSTPAPASRSWSGTSSPVSSLSSSPAAPTSVSASLESWILPVSPNKQSPDSAFSYIDPYTRYDTNSYATPYTEYYQHGYLQYYNSTAYWYGRP